MASKRAGGITSAPSLRKVQALTLSPSRRSAVNQRMVASEPVTDRFGPRSTPISTALRTWSGTRASSTTRLATRAVSERTESTGGFPNRLSSD